MFNYNNKCSFAVTFIITQRLISTQYLFIIDGDEADQNQNPATLQQVEQQLDRLQTKNTGWFWVSGSEKRKCSESAKSESASKLRHQRKSFPEVSGAFYEKFISENQGPRVGPSGP